MTNTWDGDLLGHKDIGDTFTRLVQSVDPSKEQSSKVISIEAGFGWGKTFFRKRWAQHLEQKGETVIQIDAQKSDHSGDPVVTFLGALMERLDPDPKARSKKLKEAAWKWSGVASRAVGGALIGRAIDGVVDAAKDAIDDDDRLWEAGVEGVGEGLSKAAKQMIAAQVAAEKARRELPEQINLLRQAIVGVDNRIIILIDELDRCHPDYVIALLEAMKLVFGEPGFVFVLMVNDHHLQALAEHRFGKSEPGERYLDKFVDLRLKLEPSAKALGEAAALLVTGDAERGVPGLPDYKPFSEHHEFSKERAAELMAQIVEGNGPEAVTMRQIKRLVERLELVLRCYKRQPVDLPLLVWLAFQGSIGNKKVNTGNQILPRSILTPEEGTRRGDPEVWPREIIDHIAETVKTKFKELTTVDLSGYRANEAQRYPDWLLVYWRLSQDYIPSHQAMLDYVHSLQADA